MANLNSMEQGRVLLRVVIAIMSLRFSGHAKQTRKSSVWAGLIALAWMMQRWADGKECSCVRVLICRWDAVQES